MNSGKNRPKGVIGFAAPLTVDRTVEPIVNGIFTKLELHTDAASNRRVLAVLAFLRA